MKITSLFFISLVFLGCNDFSKTNEKPYFKFDKVEHYFFDISDEKLSEIMEKENQSEYERKLDSMLLYNSPKSVGDKNFTDELKILKPKISNINSDKFDQLNQIFSEKKYKEEPQEACKPSYRHILIFKMKNINVGIAKICFHCHRFYITGTNRNTDSFGQSGDFDRLQKILK